MKTSTLIPAAVSAIFFVGCEPKERAEWSPDGSRAAVVTEEGLRFTDTLGNLSAPLANRDAEPGELLIDGFDWLADGSGLLVHRLRVATRWADLAPLLPEDESRRVSHLAEQVPSLLAAAAALHGDADRAEQLLAKLAPAEALALNNALRLALATDAAAVHQSLAGAPRALGSVKETGGKFVIHEIAALRPDSGTPVVILWRGLRGVAALKVSPRHPQVAVALSTGSEGVHELALLPLAGGPIRILAEEVTRAFDWAPDGGALVFMSSVSGGRGGVFGIKRLRILDGSGASRDEPDSEDLAYAVVAFSPRLAVLPDGDVIFPSHPVNLPSSAGGLAESSLLYRLPAGGGPPVAVPVEAGALPMDLGYFVPSPDGRRLLIVESGSDSLALLELESGDVRILSGPSPGWKTRLMPSWRSSNEFTYAVGDERNGRVRWMLWKDGESRDLSADWPEPITRGWMEWKKPTP